MIISSVILVVLGVMALIGIGSNALRDFNIPVLGLVLIFATIIGLNFVPTLSIGNFYFSLGSALLFVMTFFLWLLKGKISNRLLCLLITIVLAGLLYGATRLSAYFNSTLWSTVNVYYALMIGLLAFIFTRNAKYGFIASVLSIMTATLLTQIGGPINLDNAYSTAVIGGSTAVVLFSLVAKMMPSRPNRVSYYFETGRMLDD
ncbi:MAG: hypothetical protein EOM87_08385 [Clostridia bacterium]|nr:hypothetical protein [Clostridia bacterium]